MELELQFFLNFWNCNLDSVVILVQECVVTTFHFLRCRALCAMGFLELVFALWTGLLIWCVVIGSMMKSSARSPAREKVLRNVLSSQSGHLHQLPGLHDVPQHKPVGMIWNFSWLHMGRSYIDRIADTWNDVQRQCIYVRFASTGRFESSRPAVFLKRAAAS